jgi:hypothetical protein
MPSCVDEQPFQVAAAQQYVFLGDTADVTPFMQHRATGASRFLFHGSAFDKVWIVVRSCLLP